MTVLKFGGKFQKGAYQTSGGLHGVGVTVVNFLSEWCEVEVRRQGHVYQQEYERGVPLADVRRIGRSDRRGTKTTFKPDPQIFPNTNFQYNILYRRLQELAFLNRGVKIVFRDHRTGDGETFHYERGILAFVEYLNRASEAAHEDIIYVAGDYEGVGLEVALQYSGEFTENVHSYVNNICTTEGGTHVSGFRAAITRTINAYGKKIEPLQGPHPQRRRLPRGPDGRHLAPRARAAVRGPNQDQAGQRRNRGDRQLGRRRLPGQVSRREPEDGEDHRAEGPAGGRGPRERPQGPATRPRAQRRLKRRRTARQTPRLHQPRGRYVRAVPGRGRFGRRQRRRRTHPRISGHPPAARQNHQRLQVARRQGAGQRRGPQHDLGHRRGHRRGNGPHANAATAKSSS